MEITVTYQGIPGAFSFLAAHRYFSGPFKLLEAQTFRELFQFVHEGKATFGIVPIENSLAGSVHEVYDLLDRFDVAIWGETYLRISHCLLALSDQGKDEIQRISSLKRVYSHPKALEQCQKFFELHPFIDATVYADTARAAQLVSESGSLEIGAIASEESAKMYGLQVLRKNIEDDPGNFTRFVVIGRPKQEISGANKCSLIFTLPHLPSSLYRVLEVLAKMELNLTKIESRPIHGSPFEYNFYIDFEFPSGKSDEAFKAIDALRQRTRAIKVLGLYQAMPRA